MEKRCYKVKELQEIMGLSRASIYELLKCKEFQWVVVGGKYMKNLKKLQNSCPTSESDLRHGKS